MNVADLVTQIPSNISNFQPENTGGSAFFIGSTLANLRGLNPFFGTRTLTLVDSKRHVPTNNGNSVDLNAIPGVLIDRMEVVTGGASATYGSDAVTGVVNILLDKDLQGLKLDLDFGSSDGDGDNQHIGIAGGTELFGGRGHIVAGAEYQYTGSDLELRSRARLVRAKCRHLLERRFPRRARRYALRPNGSRVSRRTSSPPIGAPISRASPA